MALSASQKRKIEEEEQYRAKIRGELKEKPKKKGISLFSKVLVVILGVPFLLAIILVIVSPKDFQNYSNNTSEEKKDLVGHVNFDGTQFHITNDESSNWTNCTFSLNSKYNYPSDTYTRLDKVAAGETLDIGAAAFTLSDGTRFNPFQVKPQGISADCDGRFSYWQWN